MCFCCVMVSSSEEPPHYEDCIKNIFRNETSERTHQTKSFFGHREVKSPNQEDERVVVITFADVRDYREMYKALERHLATLGSEGQGQLVSVNAHHSSNVSTSSTQAFTDYLGLKLKHPYEGAQQPVGAISTANQPQSVPYLQQVFGLPGSDQRKELVNLAPELFNLTYDDQQVKFLCNVNTPCSDIVQHAGGGKTKILYALIRGWLESTASSEHLMVLASRTNAIGLMHYKAIRAFCKNPVTV